MLWHSRSPEGCPVRFNLYFRNSFAVVLQWRRAVAVSGSAGRVLLGMMVIVTICFLIVQRSITNHSFRQVAIGLMILFVS